jgi:hypothetical protein
MDDLIIGSEPQWVSLALRLPDMTKDDEILHVWTWSAADRMI